MQQISELWVENKKNYLLSGKVSSKPEMGHAQPLVHLTWNNSESISVDTKRKKKEKSKFTYTKVLASRLHKPVSKSKVQKTMTNYNVITIKN